MQHLRTIGETNADTLKLQEYITNQPHGASLGYSLIEDETGVVMNNEGRSRLRSALKTLKREFSTVRGQGIKLADPATAMDIISTKFQRIDGAVRKADKTQRNLQNQFLENMSEPHRKQLLFAGAVFGAIRLAAEQGRQIQRKHLPTQSSVSISLPILG